MRKFLTIFNEKKRAFEAAGFGDRPEAGYRIMPAGYTPEQKREWKKLYYRIRNRVETDYYERNGLPTPDMDRELSIETLTGL